MKHKINTAACKFLHALGLVNRNHFSILGFLEEKPHYS